MSLIIFFIGDTVKYIKKFVMGAFLIYAFNVIAVNFNIIIPINIWTICFTSIFDFVGLIVLILIKTIGV